MRNDSVKLLRRIGYRVSGHVTYYVPIRIEQRIIGGRRDGIKDRQIERHVDVGGSVSRCSRADHSPDEDRGEKRNEQPSFLHMDLPNAAAFAGQGENTLLLAVAAGCPRYLP